MLRTLVVTLTMITGAAVAAQTGGFTLQPIPGRPGIDGRAWMFVMPYSGPEPVVRPPGGDYELRFSDPTIAGGITRYAVTLDRGGQATLLTTGGKTASVYVTPDGRYVITQPLTVFDTKTGQRYALGEGQSFTVVAISADSHRLFVERADGEPFELDLPDR